MDIWTLGLPTPLALAAVAVVGYLVGLWVRRPEAAVDEQTGNARREIKRAKAVIQELERIAQDVRRQLATHHTSVLGFKNRISELGQRQQEAAWLELCQEAEQMLAPTLQLAAEIAHAYDKIRQQTNMLMTFTEVRTDPLTGLSNRRAFDETLSTMFAMQRRYGTPFSIVLIDIDHFKRINDEEGHLYGDRVLKEAAQLFDRCVRETDIVSRYGGEEFVCILPQTDLEGAKIFAERLRGKVHAELPITVSAGVASSQDEQDSPRNIISRADAALYSAKAAGRNLVFYHDGEGLLEVPVQSLPAPAAPEGAPDSTEGEAAADGEEWVEEPVETAAC